MKVLITPRGFNNCGLDQVAKLQSNGIEVHYNDTGKAYSHQEFITLAKDADAIIVGVDKMDADMLSQAPKLKAICKFGVGTDNIDLDYCKQNNIYVGRTIGSNSKSVAEHVIAMMFDEAKNLYSSINLVKNGQWSKPTGHEISGKSIGIIGFGMIGKNLANFANGLGMKVYAYDAFTISDEDAQKYNVTIASIDDIIENCDYISLHVPLLDSTANMISKEQFKKMKNNAVLINTARGGIVDETALYEALKNGEIRAACFDVFSTEPPSNDEPLLTLNNFFLTPHTAARTIESEKNTCAISTDIILEQLLGVK